MVQINIEKMNKIIILLLSVLSACQSNTKTNSNLKIMLQQQYNPPVTASSKAESITYNNFYESMVKAVKHYPVEPIYMVYINNEQCYYELLINDVIFDRYFTKGKRMSPFYINSHILKSGKQTLTYRLYPNTCMGFETLAEFTNLKVEIGVVDQKKGISFSNMDTILVHQAARNPDNTFIATGKDYYEFTLEFDAQVPYEEVGWTKSKDLRQMDPDTLLARTELAYQYIIDLIKNKDKDTFASILYTGLNLEYSNNYDEPTKILQGFKFLESYMENSTLKMEPLKGFKLYFYGNGRLVALQLTNPDPFYKNRCAIYGYLIDNDGDQAIRALWTFLHIPEGKDTFEML